MSNVDSNPWTLDHTLFLAKDSPNTVRRDEIRPWLFHIWIAQWLKFFFEIFFFPWKYLLFSISARFRKNLNFPKTFKTLFFSILILPLGKLSANLDIIKRSKGLKKSNKGHFVKAELVQKTLEIFNLTTKNVILMKLTAIIYLYKVFHLV